MRRINVVGNDLILLQAVANYNKAYAGRYPSSTLHVGIEQGRNVIYGTWVIGNDYRNKSTFYGAYPKGYLDRLAAMFPAAHTSGDILHCFSGGLPTGNYVRLDSEQDAELRGNVADVTTLTARKFSLVIADPPYSEDDAKKYNVPLLDRGKATRALAAVVPPGGYLCWLDTVWPMHSKDLWVTVGRITVIRSTNHRVRLLSIFERV